MYMQMMTHPKVDSELEKTARYYVGHECQPYDYAVYERVSNEIHFFSNSVFGSSKWRMSRLTRGCADNDIYSMG